MWTARSSCFRCAESKGSRKSSIPARWLPLGSPITGLPGKKSPGSLDDVIGHYKRSKFLAQQVALDHAQSGYSVYIINPSIPIGSHDWKPTARGKIIVDFLICSCSNLISTERAGLSIRRSGSSPGLSPQGRHLPVVVFHAPLSVLADGSGRSLLYSLYEGVSPPGKNTILAAGYRGTARASPPPLPSSPEICGVKNRKRLPL